MHSIATTDRAEWYLFMTYLRYGAVGMDLIWVSVNSGQSIWQGTVTLHVKVPVMGSSGHIVLL